MVGRQTKWQRGVLLGMYLVACKSHSPLDVWFTRRALTHLMWFDWHGSHTKRMNELVETKWIEQSTNESGVIVYRMTAAAHGQLSVDFSAAMANVHFAPQAEKLFDTIE